MIAAQKGYIDIVRALLGAGADANAESNQVHSVLHQLSRT